MWPHHLAVIVYSSVLFSAHVSHTCHDRTPWRGTPKFFECPVSMQKLIDALTKSPTNKAPGADEVKTEMLKTNMQLNANALFELWAVCRRCGDTPLLWRQAVVIPIHKNGTHEDPGNYRPISLLSQARKIIETTLDSAVRKNYSSHWLQLGFQKSKGTDLAILRVTELQKRGQSCIFFFFFTVGALCLIPTKCKGFFKESLTPKEGQHLLRPFSYYLLYCHTCPISR